MNIPQGHPIKCARGIPAQATLRRYVERLEILAHLCEVFDVPRRLNLADYDLSAGMLRDALAAIETARKAHDAQQLQPVMATGPIEAPEELRSA